MTIPEWMSRTEMLPTAYVVLLILGVLGLVAGVLFALGVVAWVLRITSVLISVAVRYGFLIWERSLAWASWPDMLGVVVGVVGLAMLLGGWIPGLRFIAGSALLFMGVVSCAAYIFIDLERAEVKRGHKAMMDPLKGQGLALHVARHGGALHLPFLITASGATVLGFALLNQGLFETVGRGWYEVTAGDSGPIYADFLVFAIVKLLGILDVLDLAKSHHWLGSLNVRPILWPASTLLVGFKMFFTVVLVQQISSTMRLQRFLSETIVDFWSPHDPIHERARDALPQYGMMAVGPLLSSLRLLPALTKELRMELPMVLAKAGPSVMAVLVRHLSDPHEHVREIAASALGLLRVQDAVPQLVALIDDPSDLVRGAAVEALGRIGAAAVEFPDETHGIVLGRRAKIRKAVAWLRRKKSVGAPGSVDPVNLSVQALARALDDVAPAVRAQAASGLGLIGPPAAVAAPRLIAMLRDTEDPVRCRAVEAIGRIGGDVAASVEALITLLGEATPVVKVAVVRALGEMNEGAAAAIPALVSLLHDRDEAVCQAVSEALVRLGPLDPSAIAALVEGLDSKDNVVRARTAEALGTMGASVGPAAPALVEAMSDDNDRVRAKAVQAIGMIGESASQAAVPGLLRALRDRDNWVSALAAEALGQMGDANDRTIAALTRALTHLNAWVRANSAEALGRMGEAAAGARSVLERGASDEDAGVRSQVVRALALIGQPTESSISVVMNALDDSDAFVRVAAIKSLSQWELATDEAVAALLRLMDDPSDEVKAEVMDVLPRLAGATDAVIEGLCRHVRDDPSAGVQVHAARALGKLGIEAIAAGETLLRAAQTGEVMVREQAMWSIAMIQPPETTEAFVGGLKDPNGEIRKIASAGWMKAAEIADAAVPALVAALRDPEVQVRANAAHALARLEILPSAAVSPLVACAADPYDGLRMNAALALSEISVKPVTELMRRLLADPNSRVALIAAGALLAREPENAEAKAVIAKAREHDDVRVRRAAEELAEAMPVVADV